MRVLQCRTAGSLFLRRYLDIIIRLHHHYHTVRYQLFCSSLPAVLHCRTLTLFYRPRNICSKSCPHFFRSATKPPIATHPSLYPWRSCPHFFRSATKPPIATHPPLSPWRKEFLLPDVQPFLDQSQLQQPTRLLQVVYE